MKVSTTASSPKTNSSTDTSSSQKSPPAKKPKGNTAEKVVVSRGDALSPHFREIARNLASTVDFFRDHTNLKDLDLVFYTTVPVGVDWGSANSITEAFPTLRGYGKLVMPMALIFETYEIDAKLVVINYWRLLKGDEQRKVRDSVRAFYLRPSLSSERINYNFASRVIQKKGSASIPDKREVTIRARDPDGILGVLFADNLAFDNALESLSSRVRFFKEVSPLQGLTKLLYSDVPPNLDWNDVESIQKLLPPLTTCTQRLVPFCMILECQSVEERLIVVNWWRYLDSIQQPRIMQELRRYYRAPMQSKEPMPEFVAIRDKRRERLLAPTWGFRCIETCQQLADKLGLSTDMLHTANIEPGVTCKTEGCVYPALVNNSGLCCLHRSAFAPMAGKERRKRGHLLVGAVYTKQNNRLCSCDSDICVGIGFSDIMVRFDMLRLSEEQQTEIWQKVSPKSRKAAVLAPWHFHPQHRVFLPDGSWKIIDYRRNAVFKDPVTQMEWHGLPPPTYSPKDFLEEPEMIEYMARKKTSLLPTWVREYQRLEEGPVSISEHQTNLLYHRIDQLEEKLSSQARDFDANYHGLRKDMADLQGKYENKKNTKRQEKNGGSKRKRGGLDSNGSKHALSSYNNNNSPMDPPTWLAPPSPAAKTELTSQHYEVHADNASYEKAYFYKPGAYMEHLVKLHVDRMGLQQPMGAAGDDISRRILDIGGGTGNFAQALVESVSKEAESSSTPSSSPDNIKIVVVDPFLDPTTSAQQDQDSLSKAISFVKAGAEAFLEEHVTDGYFSNATDSSWKQPGSYHQILMKEIVHHLDAKDRVGIFRGMHHGLATIKPTNNRSKDKPMPSILIVTRPQVEIDYPLWDKARQVWKENQPSLQELADDLQAAGFHSVMYTIESYPCSIALDRWQSMIQTRFWSTFSNFSDEELAEACRRIAQEYRDRIDDTGTIHFEDRLVFLTACK
ncbi:MAG: hypothetical protein SGILL_007715 [Bacillariaceae sp.]